MILALIIIKSNMLLLIYKVRIVLVPLSYYINKKM